MGKKLHLIVGTTPYCDTQQTIHNTTTIHNTKYISWFIISFEISASSNFNSPSSVNIITSAAADSSPAVATISLPVVTAPPDSVATAPPDSVATASSDRPAGICRHRRRFSSAYHIFEAFNTHHVGRYVPQCSQKQDGGRRFEYAAKTGHFEKALHLTRTLDARCPNAKFVHKNSLCFMEIIIFQLLYCLYFYDSGIEVPVCIKKPSRSTVCQPVRSYTVSSVNRLPAGAFIYRAVGQQTPSSVGSLRKVGRRSPGVQRVNIELKRYYEFHDFIGMS